MFQAERIKILIVDDELDARDCFRNYLQRRFKVDIASADSGDTAIDLVRSFSPDIMLLDIHMPRVDGWDVIREVRKFNKSLKIIVITGWATMTDEQKCLVTKDVAAYLHKPVSFEQVTYKMFEVLGEGFKSDPLAWACDEPKGRPLAREIVHALANIHGKIRIKAEAFVSNYEDGFSKDKTDGELLKESMIILKEIIKAVDEANFKVEEIRKL